MLERSSIPDIVSTMTEPRWLDADEQQAWRAYLAASRRLFDEVERQLQHESGMPHAYYEVLVRLSEAPGRRMRMSDLADSALSSRSRLSHAVARLEQLGWVRRETCPTDKRGSFAVLTDQGHAAIEAAAPGHVETVRKRLLDPLTREQVTSLREISEALLRCLDEVAGERV
jgi:DNA-binding MarR family transcriptional regulator